jgi:hypothetical protein
MAAASGWTLLLAGVTARVRSGRLLLMLIVALTLLGLGLNLGLIAGPPCSSTPRPRRTGPGCRATSMSSSHCPEHAAVHFPG